MEEEWINKAELYTLLSISFAYPTKELAQAIVSGDYAAELEELLALNGLESAHTEIAELACYATKTEKEVLDCLRLEHTRLFLAGNDTLISLYGESWAAKEKNLQPLLFIGEEARAVEKFMRSCGLGHTEERHEPLDHIAAELEFLKMLCLMRAGVVEIPEGVVLPENAYVEFYGLHLVPLAHKIGTSILESTENVFFSVLGVALKRLPSTAF